MPKLNVAAVHELLRNEAPAITMYLPTHPGSAPPNISEDQLRFKNLRSKVSGILQNMPDLEDKTCQTLEKDLDELQDDLPFWESRNKGLAIFASPGNLQAFDLPIDCDEYVAVDSRFHITPLLGLLNNLVEYYVFVVSQKHPMLFAGDAYDLWQTDLALPAADGHPSHSNTNSQPSYFGSQFPLVTAEERMHFMRAVDETICRYCDTARPLILAGPEQETEMYREISGYPRILAGRVPSNNSATNPHELYPLVWPLVERELVDKQHREALERYARLYGEAPDRASSNIAAIKEAVEKGRVGTLLIKLLRFTTDTVRDNKHKVPKLVFLPEEQMAATDYLAAQTWRQRGEILLVDESTPLVPATAAIFRY